jgi:hypothetical protein
MQELRNNSIEQLRTNATLPHEAWIEWDKEILRVAEANLGVADDIVNAGLTHKLMGIGVTESKYNRQDTMTPAISSMDTATEGILGKITYDSVSVPVPVHHKEFRLDARVLDAYNQLDLTDLATATRNVKLKLDQMVMNGIPASEIGEPVYGYTSHPDRGTYNIPIAWDDPGADPVTDVLKMITEARRMNKDGKYVLYVCDKYYRILEADFSENKGSDTLRQRIERISDISAVKVVKNEVLADDTVVLVQMDRETVDMAMARPLGSYAYKTNTTPNSPTFFRIDAIQVVRVKSDRYNQIGVVVGTR